jgi:iron(III) transport system permease protein
MAAAASGNEAVPPRSRVHYDVGPGIMLGMALPPVILIAVLLAVVLWLSFLTGQPGTGNNAYTLAHYTAIFGDSFTYQVLANTLVFSGIATIIALTIAAPIAWLVERTDFPGKSVVMTVMTISLVVPAFAVAMGWLFLLHPRIGMINRLLITHLGLSEAPFNIETILGMGTVEGLVLVPVPFIMLAAALRSMDPAVEEAAAMTGATTYRTLLRITFPLLWPAVLASGLYVFTIGFAAFEIPAIIGLPRRIFTFSTYVYYQLSPWTGAPAYANVAVLGVFMVALGLAISWWYLSLQSNTSRFAVLTGKSFRPRLTKLGRARYGAIAFVAAYLLVGQALPILMLVWASGLPFLQIPSAQALSAYSLNNYVTVLPLFLRAIEPTAILMLAVPTATVFFSVVISWVAFRSKFRWRNIFDVLAFLPHCIPSIVFSVAALLTVLFLVRDTVPLYGSVWLLVIVYVVARLSYGTRLTNTAIIQVHKDLDQAAAVCGASTLGTVRFVLLPLIAPTMLYTWIWTALLAYRELTLPVLLASAKSQPLSVVIWGLIETSAHGQASAITVLMLLLMLPLLLVYWRATRRIGLPVS